MTFDASAAAAAPERLGCAGTSAITSYAWNFGDGSVGHGPDRSRHTFTSQQTFNVTLTVTNDRGLSASSSVADAGGRRGGAEPPRSVFSPTAPTVGSDDCVQRATSRRRRLATTLTVFGWNFGDGATASGSIASHAFTAAGTYNVVLSVADDTGQKATLALSVAVTSGGSGGGGATIAAFTFSPTAPVVGQVVFFNASGSRAATGHTLTKYAWDFGDWTRIVDDDRDHQSHVHDARARSR